MLFPCSRLAAVALWSMYPSASTRQEFAPLMCALYHAPGSGRDACQNRASACCASIETCDGGAYFACLFDQLQDIQR